MSELYVGGPFRPIPKMTGTVKIIFNEYNIKVNTHSLKVNFSFRRRDAQVKSAMAFEKDKVHGILKCGGPSEAYGSSSPRAMDQLYLTSAKMSPAFLIRVKQHFCGLPKLY